MKWLFAALLSLALSPLAAQYYDFNKDLVHSDNASFGNKGPRVAIVDGNQPIVMWGKYSSPKTLYVARKFEGEPNFSDPIVVNTGGIDFDIFAANLGPQMDARDNMVYIVFEVYGEAIYTTRSMDGGFTFDDPVIAIQPEPGRVATLPGIAISSEGHPVVYTITTNPNEQEARYEVAYSDDFGQTYQPPVVANGAAAGEEVCECCPASMAFHGNTPLLTFRNNNNNLRDIWTAAAEDDPLTFDQAFDVDTFNWSANVCPLSGPSTDIHEEVLHIAYMSAASGSPNIYVSELDANTYELLHNYRLSEVEPSNYPTIATGEWSTAVAYVAPVNAQGNRPIIFRDKWLDNNFNGGGESLDNDPAIKRAPDMVMVPGNSFETLATVHLVYESGLDLVYQKGILLFQDNTDEPEGDQAPLHIAPNPATDRVIISNTTSNPIADLKLYNSQGQSLQVGLALEPNATTELTVSHLPPGVYGLHSPVLARAIRFIKL